MIPIASRCKSPVPHTRGRSCSVEFLGGLVERVRLNHGGVVIDGLNRDFFRTLNGGEREPYLIAPAWRSQIPKRNVTFTICQHLRNTLPYSQMAGGFTAGTTSTKTQMQMHSSFTNTWEGGGPRRPVLILSSHPPFHRQPVHETCTATPTRFPSS
ncbi:hypothetical protein LZ32DRAFT_445363 [Colletotrichum eremochloae]|nr:hypothetical protein LZ32DRAFT_445363 [Colletotrichum eremochloae]